MNISFEHFEHQNLGIIFALVTSSELRRAVGGDRDWREVPTGRHSSGAGRWAFVLCCVVLDVVEALCWIARVYLRFFSADTHFIVVSCKEGTITTTGKGKDKERAASPGHEPHRAIVSSSRPTFSKACRCISGVELIPDDTVRIKGYNFKGQGHLVGDLRFSTDLACSVRFSAASRVPVCVRRRIVSRGSVGVLQSPQKLFNK